MQTGLVQPEMRTTKTTGISRSSFLKSIVIIKPEKYILIMRGKNRKGQLVFEFMVAAIFFFYIVFSVINYLNITAAVFANDFYMNSLEFSAIQSSELLLHDEGVWNDSVPKRLGLADEWPVLNSTKIQYLDSYCRTNYESTLEKLDINSSLGHGLKIEINRISGGNLLTCGYLPGDRFGSIARVERVALLSNGDVLNMTVWSW